MNVTKGFTDHSYKVNLNFCVTEQYMNNPDVPVRWL